jgi:hypothetical protein
MRLLFLIPFLENGYVAFVVANRFPAIAEYSGFFEGLSPYLCHSRDAYSACFYGSCTAFRRRCVRVPPTLPPKRVVIHLRETRVARTTCRGGAAARGVRGRSRQSVPRCDPIRRGRRAPRPRNHTDSLPATRRHGEQSNFSSTRRPGSEAVSSDDQAHSDKIAQI